MKILHIMWDEKFKKSSAGLYNAYFNNGEHEICYLKESDSLSLIEKEYTIPQRELMDRGSFADAKNFISECRNYDYIVIHSYKLSILTSLFFLLDKSLRKKLVWIEWGFDLYTKKPKLKNVKAYIKYWVNRTIKGKIPHVVGIFPPDCDYYKKQYPKSKANVYYAPYCGAKVDDEFLHYSRDSRLKKTIAENDTVYIQIGHYALNRLNHVEVLKSLEKWKDENIMLFLPLSYGNSAYADEVQKYAEEKFPNKTIVLRNMMPRDEYFKLIQRIDIGIFNTARQCGLGNIHRMIFRNVKLYMAENSVMYNYFDERGIPVQSCKKLDTQSFDAFVKPVETSEEEKFAEYLRFLSDSEYRISFWKNIYDKLREDLKKG